MEVKTSRILSNMQAISYNFRQAVKNKDEFYLSKYRFVERGRVSKQANYLAYFPDNKFVIYRLDSHRYKYEFLYYINQNINIEIIDDIDYSEYPECIKTLIRNFINTIKK